MIYEFCFANIPFTAKAGESCLTAETMLADMVGIFIYDCE